MFYCTKDLYRFHCVQFVPLVIVWNFNYLEYCSSFTQSLCQRNVSSYLSHLVQCCCPFLGLFVCRAVCLCVFLLMICLYSVVKNLCNAELCEILLTGFIITVSLKRYAKSICHNYSINCIVWLPLQHLFIVYPSSPYEIQRSTVKISFTWSVIMIHYV